MSANLTIDVTETRRALAAAAPEVRDIVRERLEGALEGWGRELGVVYPRRTGRLARSVRVERPAERLYGRVRVGAAHAHLFEWGSVRRSSGQGYNRGRMPEATTPVFVPAAVRWRGVMIRDVTEALNNYTIPGFTGGLAPVERGAP